MSSMPPNVTVVHHPVVQERLTKVRDRRTGVEEFRRLVGQIARLMTYELTRDYPTKSVEIDTPFERCTGRVLARDLTLVPILRAGLGMVDGVLQLLPNARLGHVGIYRQERTLEPVVYYTKLPPRIEETDIIIMDPMLATGGSVSKAIEIVKEARAHRIKVLCLVASPEAVGLLNSQHPTVHVYAAAIDRGLNEHGYIVPGLGDAGDRLLGTV